MHIEKIIRFYRASKVKIEVVANTIQNIFEFVIHGFIKDKPERAVFLVVSNQYHRTVKVLVSTDRGFGDKKKSFFHVVPLNVGNFNSKT